ncbi:high mobility group protein HMGI-C-like protein [Columba livia]|nr:high mobility group protein HMGI-C-like protein [Columba livia]
MEMALKNAIQYPVLGYNYIASRRTFSLLRTCPWKNNLLDYHLETVESANMSNERPVNPGSSTLTKDLKRKRGRPKKQPQEEVVGPLPVKKPRGRPKGSKKVTTVSGQMPQLMVQEEASQEENPQGSSDLNLNSAPATQGIAGKDGSRSSKTTGLSRCLGNIPAAAQ